MSTIIGLVSTFRLPLQRRGGLDLEAEERQEKVQKERARVADWTLKWRGGRRKSKTQVGAQERKTRHHMTRHNICAKNYIKSHKPLALKLTSSRIIQVSNNLHFYERRGVIIMKFMDKDDFEKQNVFGTGQANTAYAKYFIGDSFLNPLTDSKCGLFLANVTFEPGCRNNWHIHHATKGGGQMLICTAGEGWYQEEGKEPVSLAPGTVITIPPEVKHWHGAKKDSWFSHIAAEIPGENTSNEWCEPVTDEEYNRLG